MLHRMIDHTTLEIDPDNIARNNVYILAPNTYLVDVTIVLCSKYVQTQYLEATVILNSRPRIDLTVT